MEVTVTCANRNEQKIYFDQISTVQNVGWYFIEVLEVVDSRKKLPVLKNAQKYSAIQIQQRNLSNMEDKAFSFVLCLEGGMAFIQWQVDIKKSADNFSVDLNKQKTNYNRRCLQRKSQKYSE